MSRSKSAYRGFTGRKTPDVKSPESEQMTASVSVTGADVPDVDGITKPDYPIEFRVKYGSRSINDVVQEQGKKLWAEMHGEAPDNIYYTSTSVKIEKLD